ncbi:MAG: penicillin-binding protein 1C [Gemmatimonadetes bacterium]|nr:penicillin-binding protein 1C [Gemmatimonadota bacterium]
MTRRARWMSGAAAALAAVLGTAGWIARPLPAEFARPAPVPALAIQDRGGMLLRATRSADGSRGGWTGMGEVDPRLVQAFLAVEDHRFFAHPGVDVRAVGRAMRDNLRGRRRAGASTLTMQTVRLLRPLPRSWGGKARQALWALRLDAHLEKRAILEQYLNRVPLGQAAVGVSAASSLYFGASARELSLGQAALLAGIARAPSRDNPLVSPERARARRNVVLGRMRELGYATADEVARAREEPVLPVGRAAPFLAPHFTTRVLQLAEAEGRPLDGAWHTSLDAELQALLEAEVRHTVRALADRGARQAAAVVLHNETGEVLAWVGSPDFWEAGAGQVDMVVSPRQPGSTLKPFLYALAFDRGHTAATVLPDVPRSFSTSLGPYRPQNYDRRFRGPVRMREALASSYNVPAVELADRLGVDPVLRTLHRAGFSSLSRSASHYGLGLALGNGDVTLLELANGYRALARGGEWTPWRWRPAAPGEPGTVRERVVSARAAALVLDVLSDAEARTPGFGLETPFDFPFPAAAKTGTSRHFTDNWAVGVTQGFTVAVWVGNFSGRPMEGVSGVTGAGPLLYRAVLATASRYAPGALPTPEETGLVPVRVCRLSGLRATPGCVSTVEWFIPGTEPARADDWERGGRVALPDEYAEWAAGERGRLGAMASLGGDGPFRILAPRDGDRYEVPVGVDPRYATVALHAAGGPGPVRWFVDGRELPAERWRLVPGPHTIRAIAPSGDWDEVRVVVEGR